MRIAYLCKRHSTGKDVLLSRSGRPYEIPCQLARLGHTVRAWSLDYRGSSHDPSRAAITPPESLAWSTRRIGGARLPRLAGVPYRWLHELRDYRPDIVVAASDIPHAVLGSWLARRLQVPYVLDLYDNFESFGQAYIPGFRRLLSLAILRADLVITVSEALRRKVLTDQQPACPVVVMHNGVDPAVFSPGNREKAREALQLPAAPRLIGTAGRLARSKGLAVVYEAWQKISATREDVHLVLAGPVESGFPPPRGSRVHYLGMLPEQGVRDMFRALDVGIISARDSTFGRFCFPQKAGEMLACGLPVVAAAVGTLAEMFEPFPRLLYAPEDSQNLAMSIEEQLNDPLVPDVPVRSWKDLIADIEPLMRFLVTGR